MYLYAQIAQGNWAAGSTFPDNFGIMEAQGIDRSADYPQGDYDYTTQPTAAEVAAAAAYKITSYSWVFFGANAGKPGRHRGHSCGRPADGHRHPRVRQLHVGRPVQLAHRRPDGRHVVLGRPRPVRR